MAARQNRKQLLETRDDVVAPPNAPDAAVVAFPQTPEDFENDPRVSFSKLENKYLLETDDGTEWEYDEALKRWIPSLDEALLEQQRKAYAVEGVDETEQVQPPAKKRKNPQTNDDTESYPGSKPKKAREDPKPAKERRNTAVYVTSLPLDTTISEVKQTFSRCGVIAEEIDSGKPRIKLYTDDNGKFKGDALIVYFRPESVPLAIQMLDDSDFRLGETGPSGKMTVKEADFSYKKVQEQPVGKTTNTKDKKKIIKKTQKMNNKLADWDDDDPSVIQDTNSRWDKVVVLKHMFNLKELEDDPAAILDIKEDIRDECSKLGPVTNVVLFDKETDGVVTVRFGNSEAADACIRMMDGRMFAGQAVEAYIADGSERFKKSSEKKAGPVDDDEEDEEGAEEGKRLDQFGQWLEQEAKDEEGEAKVQPMAFR